MQRILVFQTAWNTPSEVFIHRQLEFLAEAQMLAGVIVWTAEDDFAWQGIPVYGFRNIHKRKPSHITLWLKNALQKRLQLSRTFNKVGNLFLKRIADEVKADTILFHYSKAPTSFTEEVLSIGHRILTHVHGTDIHTPLYSQAYRQKFADIANQSLVISNSTFTKDKLLTWGVEESHIIVKYCGVPVPESPPAFDRDDATPFTILHLGRMAEVKGPDYTLQAFETACDKGLDARLVMAGDGPLMARCQELHAASAYKDRIELLGAVDRDTGEQLRQQAHIFTQHARIGSDKLVEHFGVSIVEAMADGLPVVTCALGGIKETVIDGETGIFFESENIEAQADAFLKLANDHDLRQKMGYAGWKRARDHFSLEREADALKMILAQQE